MVVVRPLEASVRAILSAKAVWVAAKDADMAEKVWTSSMIARKSRADIKICWSGGVNVLGPTESEGAGGTEGVEEAYDVSGVALAVGAVDTGG